MGGRFIQNTFLQHKRVSCKPRKINTHTSEQDVINNKLGLCRSKSRDKALGNKQSLSKNYRKQIHKKSRAVLGNT